MSDQTFLTRLQDSKIHEFVLDVKGYAGETTIVVSDKHLHEVLHTLKTKFGFLSLIDITASDHYTDEERFEIAYNLVNMTDRQRLRVSCRIEEDDPTVDSAVDIWGSAEWYEREAFDMMGIKFRNHPDLRRIYLPEDFEYFPLRKEFPQLGIPGSIQMPEKDPPKEYK